MLKTRHALVTGASRGLGRTIAEELSRQGFFVYALARSSKELDELGAWLNKSKHGGLPIACDLAQIEQISQCLTQINRPIDTVVHNLGGTLGLRNTIFNASEFQEVLGLNVLAAVEVNSLLMPSMQANGFGRVVHISSLASVENKGSVAYAAAKSLLNGYVRALGTAVHQFGIVMTAVLPGKIGDSIGQETRPLTPNPTSTKSISDLVLFLCSEESSVLSGSCIMADDGQGKVIPDWTV